MEEQLVKTIMVHSFEIQQAVFEWLKKQGKLDGLNPVHNYEIVTFDEISPTATVQYVINS